MYTIKKGALYVKDSRYCNMSSPSSYTTKASEAVKYSTREEAEKNSCVENETVVRLSLVWGE